MNKITEIEKQFNFLTFEMDHTYSYEFTTRSAELGKGVIAETYPQDYIELLTNLFKEDLIRHLEQINVDNLS